MRFYEYESRRILAREGIPLSKHGFAQSAEQAKQIAADIGGPVVIKSQVLTGGRMKAGGVKFADTPEEAEAHAREILAQAERQAEQIRRDADDYAYRVLLDLDQRLNGALSIVRNGLQALQGENESLEPPEEPLDREPNGR